MIPVPKSRMAWQVFRSLKLYDCGTHFHDTESEAHRCFRFHHMMPRLAEWRGLHPPPPLDGLRYLCAEDPTLAARLLPLVKSLADTGTSAA